MGGDAVRYRDAEEDELELLQSIRERWHEHLDGYEIGLVFRDKPQVKDARNCAATANKANPLVRHLVGWDGWIEVWDEAWSADSEDWKEYLLDHELSHFQVNSKGEFGIVGHDIEEFEAVLQRHGVGVAGLRRLLESDGE